MNNREILVVEDDPVARIVMKSALLAIDPELNITCANSTDAAYQLLAQGARLERTPYDMVISDVLFPSGPDGVDLWRYCREKYPWLDFVAVSALPFEEFFDRYRSEAEWPPFLPKPVSKHALKAVFDNLHTPWGFQG